MTTITDTQKELKNTIKKLEEHYRRADYDKEYRKLHAKEIANARFRIEILKGRIEETKKKVDRIKKACNLGERFTNRTLENWNTERFPAAYQKAVKYAVDFPSKNHGEGLIFCGDIGTGKTHLAAGISNYLMNEYIIPVYFMNVVDLFQSIKAGFNDSKEPRHIKICKNCDLLVLDDFGKEYLSTWSRETMYSIINARYENNLPMIITTNCTLKELEERVGTATFSRLCEVSTAINFKGSDYRKELRDAKIS